MEWILSSERINFRKICKDDFNNLCEILQDIEIMYAWEHSFTEAEVWEWIDKNLLRYESEGFSYFAMIKKDNDEFIGVMGPLVEEINEKKYIGLAYILNKKHWKCGYAIEGAKSCLEYAFNILDVDKVIAEIRPNNLSSRKVAEKLGMKIEGEFLKHYNNIDMQHLIYSCKR